MLGRFVPPTVLERLRVLTVHLAARLSRRPAAAAPILPGLDTAPAPMRPLHPPEAINDNPLEAIEAEVERDLRARGYLG